MRAVRAVAALIFAGSMAAVAQGASLRVAPVTLQLEAPQQATHLTVRNDGAAPMSVQARIYRWSQANGEDVLEPTDAVVVSPPIATLAPGAQSVIRVVRVARAELRGEESYRVLVDELPDPARARGGAVTLVVRHSIPVFFSAADRPHAVEWRAAPEAGGIRLSARNTGGRHLRIANLKLSAGGAVMAARDGLVGYVLSGASASWLIPATRAAGAGPITISAESAAGRFDAVAAPAAR